jgi:hypothetical protein
MLAWGAMIRRRSWRTPASCGRQPDLRIVVTLLRCMELMTSNLNQQLPKAGFVADSTLLSVFQSSVDQYRRLSYVDVIPAMKAHVAAGETAFVMYGLYVDHAHLSPRGTRIFADALHDRLRQLMAK